MPDFRIQLDTVTKGFDGNTCWVQARVGAIPAGEVGAAKNNPTAVLTMQKLLLHKSDVFYMLCECRSDDMGAHWTGPLPHPDTLGRRKEPNNIEAVICDATPSWHAKTRKLLTTGHVARYLGDDLMPAPRPRETAYAVYNPVERTWSNWATLDMKDSDRYFTAGAGSAQRYDLSDGTILLPIYSMDRTRAASGHGCYDVFVARCSFDGTTLKLIDHGPELVLNEPRGFCEPSITKFNDEFFITLRNDVRGYVARSRDGMAFEPAIAWKFDDGQELGNYNTQQHWVTHSDALYLVYTRRGLNNDHVFRHRAPLVIAQVDPKKLCVIRSTERVLIPQRGARLGNFAVSNVGPNETWVSVSEWMQTTGPKPTDYRVPMKYGADNSVYVSRILWNTPNKLA